MCGGDKPKRSSLDTGKVLYSAHWHKQRCKKSNAARVVCSNGFVKKNQGKSPESAVAVPNAYYGALYGLGSDHFNRFMTHFQEEKCRGPCPTLVFHEMALITSLLNIWSLLQHTNASWRPEMAKKYGDGAFDRMLTSLIVELLDFAAKSETRKIERHADLSGCNCCYCIESLQTTAKTLLEPHIELLEKQNKKRKREAYLAQAPERKKQRQAWQQQRRDEEEAKKKRKEDREFEKAAKAEEQALLAAERESRRCDSCSNIPPKRLYLCKSCGQKWCYSCLKASVPPRTRGLSKILEGENWDCCQRSPQGVRRKTRV